uniref:Uncharacterized protein n=1 Tax=Helianthus annuus TaxID=4232 RepID=A0A251U3V3_HELAN
MGIMEGYLCRTLTVTRYAICEHGSVYVTSLHKLAETGQTLSFLLQTPECGYITHIKQSSNLLGPNHIPFPVFAFHAIKP